MNRRRRRREDFCTELQHLFVYDQASTSQGHPEIRTTPPKASTKNPSLLGINHHGTKPVWCRNLHPTEAMYQKIQDLVTNEGIVIENVVEVKNPFLQKAYDLRKAQKRKEFGEVYESLLFHGTKKTNVDSICTNNFDWRLFGTSTGHKYGKGVSFSTSANYASYYSDRDYHKVMIVAKVLIANVCQGHSEMEYPPPGYDTSQKGDDGAVIVKYEDHEFYPAYKLYYHLEEEVEEREKDYSYYDEHNNYCDEYDGANYQNQYKLEYNNHNVFINIYVVRQ